jgi:hypothetical protein
LASVLAECETPLSLCGVRHQLPGFARVAPEKAHDSIDEQSVALPK